MMFNDVIVKNKDIKKAFDDAARSATGSFTSPVVSKVSDIAFVMDTFDNIRGDMWEGETYVELSSGSRDAIVTAVIESVDISGKNKQKFEKVLDMISKIDFERDDDDMVRIKVTVPDVWEATEKNE